MRKIAIINQKGGSGKTTTAVNLSAALAEKKRKVLLIDIDPQASTSSWFGKPRDDKGLFDLFVNKAGLKEIVQTTDIPYIDIIPSSSWLMGVEKRLAQEVGAETILKQKFQEIAPSAWDYIIIDCPPALGILTINALTAVQEIIVPVEARIMALAGLVQLLQTIQVIKERLNPKLRISGIVPCRVDLRTNHAKEVVKELQSNFKDKMYKTAIRENIRLAEAPSFLKPITDYDSSCNGAEDYRLLAKEVIKQEKSKIKNA
jgi:chromosome partitioning protein